MDLVTAYVLSQTDLILIKSTFRRLILEPLTSSENGVGPSPTQLEWRSGSVTGWTPLQALEAVALLFQKQRGHGWSLEEQQMLPLH